MKKVVVFLASALLVTTPMIAAAATGIVGDCSNCHTMHNSQQGEGVATTYDPATGTYTTQDATPVQNLLKFDCISCHAMPGADSPVMDLNGSSVPQVSWDNPSPGTDIDLAGGNFYYSSQDDRKGHNVIDLTASDGSDMGVVGSPEYGAPPGNAHADHHGEEAGVFSTTGGAPFDAFTCAGARGCHGTRSQALAGDTNSTTNTLDPAYNTWEGTRRTGIAAISGAHHNSFDGLKDGKDALGNDAVYSGEAVHDGNVVAAGYRFIPGLFGMGNTTAGQRWENVSNASHNEYYGNATIAQVSGCGDCHQEGTAGVTGVTSGGFSSRAALTSYMKVPGNSMSGFCATCHGVFHSTGGSNGTSGAFLRHPSDWVIPSTGEYSGYTSYSITAPVARPDLLTNGTLDSTEVRPGTDEVMCLSCHKAHASQYDYMLRFDYTKMRAGDAAALDQGTGCLACHTAKGILPENR